MGQDEGCIFQVLWMMKGACSLIGGSMQGAPCIISWPMIQVHHIIEAIQRCCSLSKHSDNFLLRECCVCTSWCCMSECEVDRKPFFCGIWGVERVTKAEADRTQDNSTAQCSSFALCAYGCFCVYTAWKNCFRAFKRDLQGSH